MRPVRLEFESVTGEDNVDDNTGAEEQCRHNADDVSLESGHRPCLSTCRVLATGLTLLAGFALLAALATRPTADESSADDPSEPFSVPRGVEAGVEAGVESLNSTGCTREEAPDWHDNEVVHVETPDGVTRRFRVRIHGSVGLRHAKPVPLIVVFHSYGYDMVSIGSDARAITDVLCAPQEFVRKWSLWDSFARAESTPMVLLYPDGASDSIRTDKPGVPTNVSNWTKVRLNRTQYYPVWYGTHTVHRRLFKAGTVLEIRHTRAARAICGSRSAMRVMDTTRHIRAVW